ncbi:PTS system mannose-specific EIIBCA component [Photobacterium malacitanum]|uniref:protein-N(pi)-phosphohistidine--D-fructose phosphotransferase n=1 Tax=Photobacterium malacitanum TaxID=2204294 RepID=A0A1Y6MQG3_9GAMM|nr:PTS fructose transporter subunit IIB [Photobacterium malacitanum]SMY38040.1 PTS system mannose-specific EIIBCA component [Photobacterium malacitanum]
MRVVAITACPTGIAHTYMAADKLTETAKKLGITIKVETQGAMGIENRLTEQDVERADIVILAADINVEQSDRFNKHRCLEVSIQDALQHPRRIFSQCQQLLLTHQ